MKRACSFALLCACAVLGAAGCIIIRVDSGTTDRIDGENGRGAEGGSGAAAIDAEGLKRHIAILASDEFEGRLPATDGEERTVRYLAEQFAAMGLLPGAGDGTFFQPVPLVQSTASPAMELTLSGGQGAPATLSYGTQFMGWTKQVEPRTGVADSDIIFVGYGTRAPEFEWDDFKGMDVTGKTLVMLVNDPPVMDPDRPGALDPDIFGGRAMTYYGRWTYKFEMAAEAGAAACFVVHETGPAGYPWEVVSGSWSGEQFDLVAADNNRSRCEVEGWLTQASAEALFRRAGMNFDEMKRRAVSRDFQPVELGVRATVSTDNELVRLNSRNVIARIEGRDPELRDEYVIYMAHWDHLGRDASLQGDQIYNGAMDNASGTAGLLELAEAFATLPKPPRRSLVFLAVTAEEKGLLGSRHYAENPVYPLEKTVAVINMDGINMYGPTRDIVIIGMGNSTLDDLTVEAARAQGRTVKPDAEPEKGFFYRSDHFNFAKHGVPALYTDTGLDYVGKPEGWGIARREDYTRDRYHKTADEFDPAWEATGGVQDLRLLFQVGRGIAESDEYPEWKPGTEFKAVREAMLRAAGIVRR